MTTLPILRTSERKSFQRCPQKWQWEYREGLALKGPPNIKLWFGTGWHVFVAHWYGRKGTRRGANPLKVWREWVNDEVVSMRVNLSGSDAYSDEVYIDAGKLGEIMIGNYIDKFGKDPSWSFIQTEHPFRVVIVNQQGERRVLFVGTYDGVFRDLETDFIWLLENKTAKQINTNHLEMDPQGGGYLTIADRELKNEKLIGPRDRVRGVMYNFARKATGEDDRPQNPEGFYTNQPTKKHYVEQLNASLTLTLPALEALAKHRKIIVYGDQSKNQPSPLFVRESLERTVRERNNMILRIQNEVEHMEMMRNGTLQPYKNTSESKCFWDCDFYKMCLLHESGNADWEMYRDAMFKVRDPYADHAATAAAEE